MGYIKSSLHRLKRMLTGPRLSSLRDLIVPSTQPASRCFGFDRGQPIDRWYIEHFLERCAADIRGTVLEIGDATYTRRFGGNAVASSEVLHTTPGSCEATILGDLSTGKGIIDETFDCIILTQTLPFIYEIQRAVGHCMRGLKPGGVVLATMPGICQISRYDMNRWGDYWRFSDASARRLFESVFGTGNVKVESHGNVLAACAFLRGFASDELGLSQLANNDPDYQVIITVRAQKVRC